MQSFVDTVKSKATLEEKHQEQQASFFSCDLFNSNTLSNRSMKLSSRWGMIQWRKGNEEMSLFVLEIDKGGWYPMISLWPKQPYFDYYTSGWGLQKYGRHCTTSHIFTFKLGQRIEMPWMPVEASSGRAGINVDTLGLLLKNASRCGQSSQREFPGRSKDVTARIYFPILGKSH